MTCDVKKICTLTALTGQVYVTEFFLALFLTVGVNMRTQLIKQQQSYM